VALGRAAQPGSGCASNATNRNPALLKARGTHVSEARTNLTEMNTTEKNGDRESSETKPRTPAEIRPAEAAVLTDMVGYQTGAVVSRAILGRKTGTITLFAFDEGQGLSEHTAPFDALVHVLEGKAEIVIDGERFELGSGEAILMPANRPHALQAISRFKMLLIMMRS